MQVDDLHLYLKCHSSTGFFKNFAGKNQLSGFYVTWTLVENGLVDSITLESEIEVVGGINKEGGGSEN